MSTWKGVRPGSKQNTALDFLEKRGGLVETASIAQVLYGDKSYSNRGKARAAMRALMEKDLVLPAGKTAWKLQATSVSVSMLDLEERLREAERRVGIIERDSELLLQDFLELRKKLSPPV